MEVSERDAITNMEEQCHEEHYIAEDKNQELCLSEKSSSINTRE